MAYKVKKTSIEDVLLLEPEVFGDERGFFFESFNQQGFNDAIGESVHFVQDNHSRSRKGVLRGLHFQENQAQGKLVRVIHGEIYDVAVDIRPGSPTFGKWVSAILSATNKVQAWMPAGFAHGFLVTSDVAEVLYKTTDYYAPHFERTIVWDDGDLAIDWPITTEPILSDKDKAGTPLSAYAANNGLQMA